MRFEHENEMYPPRVQITAQKLHPEQRIKVEFSNVLEKDKLEMDFTLRPGRYLFT